MERHTGTGHDQHQHHHQTLATTPPHFCNFLKIIVFSTWPKNILRAQSGIKWINCFLSLSYWSNALASLLSKMEGYISECGAEYRYVFSLRHTEERLKGSLTGDQPRLLAAAAAIQQSSQLKSSILYIHIYIEKNVIYFRLGSGGHCWSYYSTFFLLKKFLSLNPAYDKKLGNVVIQDHKSQQWEIFFR